LSILHSKKIYHYTLENVEDAYFKIVNGSIIYSTVYHGLDMLVDKFKFEKGILPTRLKNFVPGNLPPNSALQLGFHTHLLHRLVIEGSFNLVNQVIRHPKCPQINTKDSHGNTPLHLATYEGRFDLIQLLLRAGASVNMKDKDGKSVLHVSLALHIKSLL